MKNSPQILVVRTDRLGDVLLCLPALEFLRASLPEAEIHFLCNPAYHDVLAPFCAARRILLPTPQGEGFFSLRKWLRTQHFDAILALYSESPLLFAALWDRVPVRVGLFSKPWSLITLNRGLQQHRSRAEKNEAEYNIELARMLLRGLGKESNLNFDYKIEIPMEPGAQQQARGALQANGLTPDVPYVVIHPGMGGSALNLNASQYKSVIDLINENVNVPVVITSGPAMRDREILDALKKSKLKATFIDGVSLPVLREIFRGAKWVIAPSTGPLHLANYAGTKTIGIYSPVRSHHPRRWRPWGGKHEPMVLYPTLPCPGEKNCIGHACQEYLCMDKFLWPEEIVRRIL